MAPPALFEGFPFNAFRRATPAQLLAFLKILGVEQRQVAASLGVSLLWFNKNGHLDKGDKIDRGGVQQWQRSDGSIPRSSNEKPFVS